MLAGKDKGKQGKVVVVDRNFNRVYVQGLHTVSWAGKAADSNNEAMVWQRHKCTAQLL